MDQDVTWYGARPQPRRLCVKWGPRSPPQKGGRAPWPIFGQFLLWPNGWMHQDATWYGCRAQPRGLCVRWGPSPSSPRRGTAPKFSTHVNCGQTAGWMKLVLGTEVGLSPGNFVLDGDPVPFPQKGRSPLPKFSAHLYWGETAACIKVPLGMDLGLGPGDFVLDGDPAPPSRKRAQPLNFRPISVAAKWLHGSRCHLVWR